MSLFAGLFYLFLFGPLLLVLPMWLKRGRTASRFSLTILLLTSLSYGYLLGAIRFKAELLGPDYSDRLFLTVQVGTAFTLVLFVLAAVKKSERRPWLMASAFMVSMAWYLVWVINTVV